MNKNDLADKVAIVTGGAGVLAGAIASFLASRGANIVLLGRNGANLLEKQNEIEQAGGTVISIEADVTNREALLKARTKILDKWNRIDILLNAAGGNMPGAVVMPEERLFDMSIEAFREVTDLNLTGSVLPSLVFGESMVDQGKGVIVNFSSMTVDRAITRVAGYSAGKAAIENFTRWMAVEMATKYGESIRVNAVAPGFFIGKQNKALLTNEDGSLTDRGEKIIRNTPMGRFGESDELNGSIEFLCTDASKFVTGVVIPIDGGFSAYSGV
jgi:NAD(P)-dependent dehydrogenase (short-subunit alcohol dehydrogenase family)